MTYSLGTPMYETKQINRKQGNSRHRVQEWLPLEGEEDGKGEKGGTHI